MNVMNGLNNNGLNAMNDRIAGHKKKSRTVKSGIL